MAGVSVKPPVLGKQEYTSLPEIKGLPGFIVHIKDALRFHIDIQIPDAYLHRYKDVDSETYQMQDFSEDGKTAGIPRGGPITSSKAYSCRIKDIRSKQARGSKQSTLVKSAQKDLVRATDATGGWVIVDISDIDIYGRLLVVVRDYHTKQDITEMIHCQSGYKSLYERYNTRRE